MKRIVSFFLTVAMLMTMIVPAFAADAKKTITITNTTAGHKYTAYQIFTGTLAAEPEEVALSNAEGATKYPVYEIIQGINTFKVYKYEDNNYYKVSAVKRPEDATRSYVPREADKVTYNPATDVITAQQVQHMTGMDWGRSVTPMGKVVMFYEYGPTPEQTLSALKNEFDTSKASIFEANKAFFEAAGITSDTLTIYDVLVLNHVDAYKIDSGNEGTYAEVDADIRMHITTSAKLRGTGDKGAIALATLLKDTHEGEPCLYAYEEGKDTTNPYVKTSTGGSTVIEVSSSDGYYLIEDSLTDASATDKAISRYIVEVAGNVTVANKGDAPKVVKKVYDNESKNVAELEQKDARLGNFDLATGSEGLTGGFWNDNADYSIGDTVPFKLIGTLPATYAGYQKYSYKFTDTISEGLTIDPDSITVYLLNGTAKTPVYANGHVRTGVDASARGDVSDDGKKLEVIIPDVKTLLGSKVDTAKVINSDTLIVVEYNARLNENAQVGLTGNTNKVSLTYSNNPNAGHEGETGTTKEDTVVVYTYQANLKKVDAQSPDTVALAGAEFKLEKLTSTGSLWWNKSTDNVITWVADKNDATPVVTTGEGNISFVGLDDGKYLLHETVAPFGYTLPADPFGFEIKSDLAHSQTAHKDTLAGVPVTISQTTGYKDSLVSTDTAAHVTNGDGIVNASVKNSKQDHLPTTGGMGTTLFYVAGTVMVVAAGVVLVLKKRVED